MRFGAKNSKHALERRKLCAHRKCATLRRYHEVVTATTSPSAANFSHS